MSIGPGKEEAVTAPAAEYSSIGRLQERPTSEVERQRGGGRIRCLSLLAIKSLVGWLGQSTAAVGKLGLGEIELKIRVK